MIQIPKQLQIKWIIMFKYCGFKKKKHICIDLQLSDKLMLKIYYEIQLKNVDLF